MKVLDLKVNWSLGWANEPSVMMLIDKDPDGEWIYTQVRRGYNPDHGLYWAQNEGLVRIYNYRGPDEGFGGSVFKLKMESGETRELKGPWSCGAAYANQFFPPSMEVSFTDEQKDWKRGWTFWGGYALVSVVQEALERLHPHATVAYHWTSAGKGFTSDAQTLAITSGSTKPYGNTSVKYFIACKDGRQRPSYTEALEWGDDPHEAPGFKLRRVELGLDSPEQQEEFSQWYRVWHAENKDVMVDERRDWFGDGTFTVPWQWPKVWEAAKEAWSQRS